MITSANQIKAKYKYHECYNTDQELSQIPLDLD